MNRPKCWATGSYFGRRSSTFFTMPSSSRQFGGTYRSQPRRRGRGYESRLPIAVPGSRMFIGRKCSSGSIASTRRGRAKSGAPVWDCRLRSGRSRPMEEESPWNSMRVPGVCFASKFRLRRGHPGPDSDSCRRGKEEPFPAAHPPRNARVQKLYLNNRSRGETFLLFWSFLFREPFLTSHYILPPRYKTADESHCPLSDLSAMHCRFSYEPYRILTDR